MDETFHETEPRTLDEMFDQLRLFLRTEKIVAISMADFDALTAEKSSPDEIYFVELIED